MPPCTLRPAPPVSRVLPVLAALVGLVLPLSPARADLGGDAVRLDVLPAAASATSPSLAVAADGTLFAAFEYATSFGADPVIRVYRSTDGGTTWDLWDTVGGAGVKARAPEIAVSTQFTSQVFLLYEHEDGVVHELRLLLAGVTQPAPVWIPVTVKPLTGSYGTCELEVRSRPAAFPCVYVVTPPNVGFLVSVNGGFTFGAEIFPAALPGATPGMRAFDLSVEGGDSLQLAYSDLDALTGDATVHVMTAANHGATPVDWTAPNQVTTAEGIGGLAPVVAVAASPAGDQVLLAVEDYATVQGATQLFVGAMRGALWPLTPKVLDSLLKPVASWSAGGVAVAAYRAFGLDIARPVAGVTGSWASERMMGSDGGPPAYASSFAPGHDVAHDASRGDALVLLTSAAFDFSFDPLEGFFDAEWRGAPGYGVSEAGSPAVNGHGVINSAPALGDVDGDGAVDVVFTTDTNTLARRDLGLLPEMAVPLPAATSAASAPVLFDLAGDARPEMVVGMNGGVAAYNAIGQAVAGWPVNLGTGAPTWVSAGIVTGYAREIVAASDNAIALLSPAGAMRPGFPVAAPPVYGDVVGRAAIGDVDDDGDTEIVAAFELGVVILGPAGAIERVLYSGLPRVSTGVSMADLDGDLDLEIAIPRVNGSVALLHHDGSSFGAGWPYVTGTGSPVGPVAIADVNADGQRELAFGVLSGELYVVNLNGNPPPGWAASTGARASLPDPVIQNAGDPGLQLVVGAEQGFGHAWIADAGDYLEGWPRDFWAPITTAAAAGDLDGDGSVELVMGAGERMWVLDMGVGEAAADRRWPMSGYNARRSGCADCPLPSLVGVGEAEAPAAVQLVPAVNPARGSASLAFSLDVRSLVDVAVHDARGARVRTLRFGEQDPGTHRVTWDGRDDAGRAAAAGTYFVRLVLPGRPGAAARTAKVTLIP